MRDECYEFACVNLDDGRLVFEPRETLTENEKEKADLHVGCCLACQTDMDFDFLMNQIGDDDSRS